MRDKHPLLFNLLVTMSIQTAVYLIIIFDTQIVEPVLRLMGGPQSGNNAAHRNSKIFCKQGGGNIGGGRSRSFQGKGLFLGAIISADIYRICALLSGYYPAIQREQYYKPAVDSEVFRLWNKNIFRRLHGCFFVSLSAYSVYVHPYNSMWNGSQKSTDR